MGYNNSMTLDASMWNGSDGEVSSCVINNVPLVHVLQHFWNKFTRLLFILSCFMYLFICLCFLCVVICMHSFHSAHIFIVYNSVICTHSFNNGHIIFNYKAHFVYNPLNSYVYIHWTLNILLLLLTSFLKKKIIKQPMCKKNRFIKR